ncbi:hypothetical protein ACFSZS_12490 [Seohaeicola zhoushanensis]
MDRFDGQKLAEVQTALGGVHVPRAPLALFHFLWTRRGTVVAWESLIDFMESTYSGWTTLDIRDVQGYLKKSAGPSGTMAGPARSKPSTGSASS